MVKYLSCVSCAAWNVFSINSLPIVTCIQMPLWITRAVTFSSEQHFRSQKSICIKPNDSRQLYLISLVILNEHSGGPLRPNQSRSLKRSFRNWLRLGRVWPWLVIELNLWDWREWSKFFHSVPVILTKCRKLNNFVDINFHLFEFIWLSW